MLQRIKGSDFRTRLKVSLELRDYFRPESDLLEDVAGAIKVLYTFPKDPM